MPAPASLAEIVWPEVDDTAEARETHINSLGGRRALSRVTRALEPGRGDEPEQEDWGWYTEFKQDGVAVMVGVSSEREHQPDIDPFMLQVSSFRWAWLPGQRQRITDAIAAMTSRIDAVLAAEPSVVRYHWTERVV